MANRARRTPPIGEVGRAFQKVVSKVILQANDLYRNCVQTVVKRSSEFERLEKIQGTVQSGQGEHLAKKGVYFLYLCYNIPALSALSNNSIIISAASAHYSLLIKVQIQSPWTSASG